MRRIVGLILVVVLTIFATVAETLRSNVWSSYRDYSSPYLADLPSGQPHNPVSHQVILVLVRGLRLSDSRQMDTLNALRKRGADVVVQHSAPTFRLPSWVALFSGASPEVHGATTNYAPRKSGVDSIFRQMQLSGQLAAIVGSQSLGDAFGSDVQRFEVVENPDIALRDDDALRISMEVLKDAANPVRLLVVELNAIEETLLNNPGNLHAVLSVTDSRIKALADTLDPNATTLMIMSDRGLSSQGSDGGEETDISMTPLVMAGAGVAVSNQALVQLIDIAPTIATLEGIPLPVHAQGAPALAVLSLPAIPVPAIGITPATPISAAIVTSQTLAPLSSAQWSSAVQLTTFYESWSERMRQPRFAAELLRAEQAGIKSGDAGSFEKFVVELHAMAGTAVTTRLSGERAQRLPLVVGGVLSMIALIGISLASRRWQPFVGVALYGLAWYALFFLVRDYRNSLTMFTNSDPALFLNGVARDSSVLLIVFSILTALTTGKHEDGLDAMTTVLTTLSFIALVQAALVLWFYAQWGYHYTWNLPDSAALVTALVAFTQASAFAIRIVPELPSLPLPLLAAFLTLAIYSLVRQRPRREHYGRLR